MKVELVSKTTGLGKYENLTTEEIVSAIARHGVIKEDNGKLVKYLLTNKHLSPLDMVNFCFAIETSLSIGRQCLRHFSLHPQEYSGRYAEALGYESIELRLEHPTNRQSSTQAVGLVTINECSTIAAKYFDLAVKMKNVLFEMDAVYKQGIELGIAKECMRFINPNCTTTKMHFNGTLRSWLAFLNLRMDSHSQKEIQDIATLIGEALEKEMPNVFSQIDWRNGMFL